MRIFWGLILVAIGAIFLADNMRWIEFDFSEFIGTWWPVVLVVIGGWMIFERVRPERPEGFDFAKFTGREFKKTFGDVHLRPVQVESGGLSVHEGIGEIQLNLRQTTLIPGENRVDCNLGIGDIKVMLPEGIPVSASAQVGVGDIEMLGDKRDGFGATLEHIDANYGTAEIRIKLFCKVGLGDIIVTK